ncbi:histone deacetylase HDA1 [Lodderomyces elongisporus NRRL YB-4239]|uniref:Histone deacetylase HDA1 n=1 Tax=Lodderomyces elongisporus (strain ATCC 11503 / CBS 2605 / JCM 1781 / NBRC 1676 / NRRL YB-4239) TaxID=379508 RepID=A5DRS6_LODEL|nr:histone deacetylase HDA1 [Lodderomyces elongisporus NRRL YB-4239]
MEPDNIEAAENKSPKLQQNPAVQKEEINFDASMRDIKPNAPHALDRMEVELKSEPVVVKTEPAVDIKVEEDILPEKLTKDSLDVDMEEGAKFETKAETETETETETGTETGTEIQRETKRKTEQDADANADGNKYSNSNGDELVDTDVVEPATKKIKLETDQSNGNEQSNGKIDSLSPAPAKLRPVIVQPSKPQLFYTPLKTGLVYDVRMRYHAKIFTSYFEYTDPHPEDPRRIYRIYKRLAEAGLVQDPSLSGIDELGPFIEKIPIREATIEEILEVHSEKHLEHIQSTETMTKDELLRETATGDSIYVNNDSYFSAKLSCGGTIEACKAVIEGRVKNSLAAVRPPGHHAEPDDPGGFCLFSNVAVAAKNILKSYPESVRRIVILDWDIHHGNGTQKSFYDDPRVLYISLHRYENGKFYPGTKYGGADQVGEGAGKGYNINIPWRTAGMRDGDYVYAFNKVVIPTILEFDPDLIIVSSGFDAADGDVIGGCHVSPAGYGYMTHMLKGIAKGKLAVILEGGYNLDSISESALAVAKVLIGEPPENTVKQQPHPDTIEVIDEVIKIQSRFWECLSHGVTKTTFDDVYDLPDLDKERYKLTNISDPIRSHQNAEAFAKREFINIPIVNHQAKDHKQSSFTCDIPDQADDIVMASPDIYECSTVIITIHDPPELWAYINPTNGVIESNSTIVLEQPLFQIMDKVAKEKDLDNTDKIGYMDINIPSFQLPIPGLSYSHESSYNPTIFAQELLLYIWDNYIAYFQQLKKVIFVGFGDAYQSIVHLFSKRPSQEIKNLVKFTVAYLNRTQLKPIVPVMDESMVDWFYHNSTIFTSCYNQCWSTSNGNHGHNSSNSTSSNDANGGEELKKPRRKFGRVLKAKADGLFDVINEKFDEGVDNILDSIEDYSSSDE